MCMHIDPHAFEVFVIAVSLIDLYCALKIEVQVHFSQTI
jgi:hypothetical protein